MKKLWKRMLPLTLAGTMLLSCVACGKKPVSNNESQVAQTESVATETESVATESQGKDLSWLKSSQSLPLVEEGTEKTLDIYIRMTNTSPEPDDMWFLQFIEEAMNINVNVTKFTNDNKNELLPLLFAGGDLPDMIIGAGFSTTDLMKYGATEGQLIDIAPYLNETYMPNLTAIYEENPSFKAAVQDSEGHIWSTGFITDTASCEQVQRVFWNLDLLEELNLEIPETIDELLEVARAIKAAYPDMIPLGGRNNTSVSPESYILNGFGYVLTGNNAMSIALRNGEVVLPAADREAYGAYLTFMNTLYEEELIHPDYFTMDNATMQAVMVEGKNAFYEQAPFLYRDDYQGWWGALPLTSEYNDVAQWPSTPSALSCGNAVITSACEEPELAATFIDWFYTYQTYITSVLGAHAETEAEYLYDEAGWYYDENFAVTHNDMKGYEVSSEYGDQRLRLWGYNIIGNYIYDGSLDHITDGVDPNTYALKTDIVSAMEDPSDIRHDDAYTANGNNHYKLSLLHTVGQHMAEDVFPAQVYFDAETSGILGNLSVAIEEYAKTEAAKFITGTRSLDELDEYFDEIEALGAKEYIQYYKDYYESQK